MLSIVKSREHFSPNLKIKRKKLRENLEMGGRKVRETNKWSVCGDYFDSS